MQRVRPRFVHVGPRRVRGANPADRSTNDATIKDIEYMDEGFVPGWQHGFVTVWFCKKTGEMYVKQHEIQNGTCEFNGMVYRA